MLGNRIGLPFGGSPMSLVAQLKRSGAVMALFADSITGIKYQTLSPRTLPNGIKNSDTIQRVSGDVVLQASDVSSLDTTQVSHDVVFLLNTNTPNINNITGNGTPGVVSDSKNLFSNLTTYSGVEQYGHFVSGNAIRFVVPKGTFVNLQSVKDYFTGTVIRYQLATPIDTLNTPPPTPWIDLTGNTNNALMQGLANTQDSGMAYVPLVCETGTPVEYENIATTKAETAVTLTSNSSTYATDLTTLGGSKRVYVTGLFNAVSGTPVLSLRFQDATTALTQTIDTVNERASFIGTTNASATNKVVGFYTANSDITMKEQQLINLTDNPLIQAIESQLGREITALECDRLFPFVATTGVSKIAVRPLMVFDGINDYGILANNPSIDIVGTGDFAIAVGFLTPSIVGNTTLYFDGNNGVNVSERKIQFYIISDGTLAVILEGNAIALSIPNTIIGNAYYDCRLERKSGRLTCELNGGVTYNQPNTLNLISKSFKRVGARTNDAAGSTHSAYFKGGIGWLVGAKGAEIANLDKVLDKIARNFRMMG